MEETSTKPDLFILAVVPFPLFVNTIRHRASVVFGNIKDIVSDAKYHGQPAHIHNTHTRYLLDTGIVGFLSLVLILGYPFLLVIKYSRVSKHAIYLAVTALCFALASVTEVSFIRNNRTSIFLYFCIVFAATMFRELRDRQQQLRAPR